MERREIDLSVSCFGAVKDLDYQMAVIPWGATEPHNFHLPYLTDAILSHDVAVDSAKIAFERYDLRVMVMPWVAMGSQNPGQRNLKFCVHTRQETQKAILTDIVSSLYNQGIRRIMIINGHGGNIFKGFIRDLAMEFPDLLIASSEWYKMRPAKDYFEDPGDHADELETSVMMYYHPELVNLDEAGEGKSGGFVSNGLSSGKAWIPRNWLKVSHDTGIGYPLKATAEKGKKFAQDIAKDYAKLFHEFCQPEQELYKAF
ncbi:MAG: creatininase family protein [Muribaculaceae bacterium]|nr:creatininase family protein [Muribaculaceae bacterium]